jgi:hypothetical protein
MRRIAVSMAAWLLATCPAAFAQEWVQYASKADLFAVNFPSEPKALNIAYTSEFGISLPGHVYNAEQGQSHYLMTVVDYNDAEKIHTARAQQCRAGGGQGDACQNDWRSDVQGSMIFAASKFVKRAGAKVDFFGWAVVDQVEGLRVQLTNADASRTFAEIHRHGTRLYISEATVPRGAPAPGLFQQSLMFIDEEGKPIRYRSFYTTGYSEGWKFPAPAPPHTGAPPAAPPPPAATAK